MEYDKKNFQKTNDKKILHKIRKHWVVVSTALLMALGGGAVAATHVSANADATNANNGSGTSSTDTIKEHLNQQLQTPQQSNNNQTQTAVSNNGETNSQNTNQAITNQASVLHDRIMMNAGRDNQQTAPQFNNDTNQGRVGAAAPEYNNNNRPKMLLGTGNPDGSASTSKGASNSSSSSSSTPESPDPIQELKNMGATLNTTSTPSDPNTNTYYTTGYEFSDAANLNSDDTEHVLKYDATSPTGTKSDTINLDTNPSDYGALTVDYVDKSDNNLSVSTTSVSDEVDGTYIDKDFYLNNLPTGGNNAPDGYQLKESQANNPNSAILSGFGIHQIVKGQRQYLIIDVQPKTQVSNKGEVLIQYINQPDGRVLSYMVNSNSDKNPNTGAVNTFDQDAYIANVPQNFQLASDNSWTTSTVDPSGNVTTNTKGTKPINGYDPNNKQVLNIYVKPIDTTVSTTIDYVDKKTGQVVKSRSISGNAGATIDYQNTWNVYLPQGYTLISDAASDASTLSNNMTDPVIYVKAVAPTSNNTNNSKNTNIPNPNGTASDTIYVNYVSQDPNKENGQTIETITTKGKNGTSLVSNPTKNNYLQNPPAGWTVVPGQDVSAAFSNTNNPQSVTIYVNNYVKDTNFKKVDAEIDYVYYDPNNPSTLANNTAHPYKTYTISDYPGTPIDMNVFNQFIPAGYRFDSDGTPIYSTVQQGVKNVVYITKDDDVVEPIAVKYINEEGQTVNSPKDNGWITSKTYGKTFSDQTIANDPTASDKNPIPSDYQLNLNLQPGQPDPTYTVNSDKYQVAYIPVKGITQGTGGQNGKNKDGSQNKSDVDPSNADNLVISVTSNVYGNQYDATHQENQLGTKTVTYSVVGNAGEDRYIDPKNFMPNPSSDYSTTKSDETDQFTIGNKELDPTNANKTFGYFTTNPNSTATPKSDYKNELNATFNYIQKAAMATVTYEDQSDGNNIVGNTMIQGVPSTPMSDYYGTSKSNVLDHLNSDAPYGYKYASDATGNADTLVNGNDYVIYVTNSHLQPQPTVTPNSDVGYVVVNYGSNLGTKDAKIYDTVTMSGSDGTEFPQSDAPISDMTTGTDSGGYMPDIFDNENPKALPDQHVRTYNKNKVQVYNVDVDGKPASTQQVSDAINYVTIDPTNNKQKVLETKIIHGTDGNVINYAPYIDDVPEGYYYNGISTVSTLYDNGLNKAQNPIATIYLNQAADRTTNKFPNYYPENEVDNQGGKNHDHSDSDDGSNPSATGMYWPIEGSNAPVTSENYNDPITGYDGKAKHHIMPSTQDNGADTKGYVPKGYVPGWISDASGNYTNGYIPSDDIPDNYMPGYVPNGRGQYVPGYVPIDHMPSGQYTNTDGTGKTVVIPSYKPGYITNGDGKGTTIPGWVPDTKGMSVASEKIMIQYVDADNHADIISDVYAGGTVGTDLKLTTSDKTGKQFLNDIPVGYTSPSDLGENGNTDPLGKNKDHMYEFMGDEIPKVQIAVKKLATGNVIYKDSKTGLQVGNVQINGTTGDDVDFSPTGDDYQYTQLLPYGYTLDAAKTNLENNPTVLENGANYYIDVDNAHMKQPVRPTEQNDYGQIVVNYVVDDPNQKDNGKVIGTESFTGKDGGGIPFPARTYLGYTAEMGGLIPAGYMPDTSKTYSNDVGNAEGTTFTADQTNVRSIHVVTDTATNAVNSDQEYSDKIAYQVVTPTGDVRLDQKKGGGVTLANGSKSDTGEPLTFTIRGKAGTTIDYTPYQDDVPFGYEYDGMGDNSSVIDAGHIGTNGIYDNILLRKPSQNAVSLGTITVNYVNKQTGQTTDSVKLSGIAGTSFNLGYYEENLPSSISDDQFVGADNAPLSFTSDNQVVNVSVQQATQSQNYSSVHVYFVKANDVNDNPTEFNDALKTLKSTGSDTKAPASGGPAFKSFEVPNSQPEVMTGHQGDIFTPHAYEYNVPEDTTFDKIEDGDKIVSFTKDDQYLVIGVDTTNGAF